MVAWKNTGGEATARGRPSACGKGERMRESGTMRTPDILQLAGTTKPRPGGDMPLKPRLWFFP